MSKNVSVRTLKFSSIFFSFLIVLNFPALQASDFIVGIGHDDVLDATDSQSTAIVLEYHLPEFYQWKDFSFKAATAIHYDTDEDFWIGFGIAADYPLNENWFLEMSLMPGYYNAGDDGSQLGYDVEFRSLLGFAYILDQDSSLSLSIDHKSNADLGDENKGSETVSLRYRLRF
ncbi:acyloxyacyl hydrolase [Kangiella sp. TOML190]|uniref:acyloxyacyl hydrolase n=1 Tax=Kangiella sp. TOML190 TaxID=2931351 RepID=UPI00203EE004|nr:acyloxyacyl hydrolase [Kangiella sp. TOML190]